MKLVRPLFTFTFVQQLAIRSATICKYLSPLLFKNKFSPKWSRLNKNKHNCSSFSVYSLGFWHLCQLKFEEISPKLQRIQILRTTYLAPWESKKIWEVSKNADFRKTGPPAAPVYSPPGLAPLGFKNFLGGFRQVVRSNPFHLAQKIVRIWFGLVKQTHDPLCGCTVCCDVNVTGI